MGAPTAGETRNVLIVHAHPEPTSFNAALTDRARAALTRAGHAADGARIQQLRMLPQAPL